MSYPLSIIPLSIKKVYIKKTCIVILGPTAVGKTGLGIQIAQYFSTEIISADSRQCFKELNIGVAKPSPEQLQLIPHHFINSHSINEDMNAAVFENYALQKTAEIFAMHDIAVMVGGTGLYIKAFCEGLDEIPAIVPAVKEKIIAGYEAKGMDWLQQELQKNDPDYYRIGETKNPHRLLRALEVKLSTGRSIISFQKKEKIERDFDIIKIGLELPREELYKRVTGRVDKMLEDGLLKEIELLHPHKNLNALQTVGYKELFSYLEGAITLTEAITGIKQNTRHYAKRQMTWFKKDKETIWCTPEYRQLIKLVKSLTYDV